jgi:hypothetical protein
MARAAETYRGARRNAARERGEDFMPRDGSRQTDKNKANWQSVTPKLRPVQPQGWDWRKGGRAERNMTADA